MQVLLNLINQKDSHTLVKSYIFWELDS